MQMERRKSGVGGLRQKERKGYHAKLRRGDLVRDEKERETDGESWGAGD